MVCVGGGQWWGRAGFRAGGGFRAGFRAGGGEAGGGRRPPGLTMVGVGEGGWVGFLWTRHAVCGWFSVQGRGGGGLPSSFILAPPAHVCRTDAAALTTWTAHQAHQARAPRAPHCGASPPGPPPPRDSGGSAAAEHQQGWPLGSRLQEVGEGVRGGGSWEGLGEKGGRQAGGGSGQGRGREGGSRGRRGKQGGTGRG